MAFIGRTRVEEFERDRNDNPERKIYVVVQNESHSGGKGEK